MSDIKFLEPTNIPEAVSLLDQYTDDSKVIAGGTSVVLMLQQKLIMPSVLISLGRVDGHDYIRLEEDGLHIGALTTLRDIERSDVVKQFCPALAHTCKDRAKEERGRRGDGRIRKSPEPGFKTRNRHR